MAFGSEGFCKADRVFSMFVPIGSVACTQPLLVTGPKLSEAVVQMLAFGLGVTINPFVVIAMVLLLSAPSGRPKAIALLAGWALALLVTSSVVLMFADSSAVDSGDHAPTWMRVSMGVIAVALLFVAANQWRSRPRGDEQPELPAWMDRFTAFSPWKTAQTGFVLVVGNPKTLLLVAGAAVAVSEANLSSFDQLLALAVFVLVGCIGPGIPLAIQLIVPERATAVLTRMRGLLVHYANVVVAAICVVIAVALISGALEGLLG